MVWTLVRRGLAVGAVAGLLAGAFAFVVGEPLVQDAIDLERAASAGRATAPPAHAGDWTFGRSEQRGGLLLATALYGIAAGGLFAIAFAALRGRGSPRTDWELATRLAGAVFVAIVLVPFVKYPPNPPAVGDPATIGQRSALYVVVLAWSLVAAALGWKACAGLRRRAVPEHLRLPASVGLAVVVVVVGLVALPAGPDPATAPAALVWRFRLASLAGAAALWAVTGTVFGWLRLARP